MSQSPRQPVTSAYRADPLPPGQPALPVEQRRRQRRLCPSSPSSLAIHPMDNGMMGQAVPVQSVDFTTLGLGLVHSEPMDKGTQFLVPLSKRSGPPLPLLYSVIHCRPLPGGMFQIGAELLSVLDMDEFARCRPEESITQYMSEAVVGETE
jgi:hypothetical protein